MTVLHYRESLIVIEDLSGFGDQDLFLDQNSIHFRSFQRLSRRRAADAMK